MAMVCAMRRLDGLSLLLIPLCFTLGCDGGEEHGGGHGEHGEVHSQAGLPPRPAEETAVLDPKAVLSEAQKHFGSMPNVMAAKDNKLTQAKVDLGRQLYYDTRLSKSQTISCNSCHNLEAWGVDGKPTSPGHDGALGDRNSPTVYHAAAHLTQFWDGREPTVEAQALGPILNPVEMAMDSESAVEDLLHTIPGYVESFDKAFPDSGITYKNVGMAIGAFERRLVTPSRFDAFIDGDTNQLSGEELAGLDLFMEKGCIQCHSGATFGGTSYQKLGVNKTYATKDEGRYAHTKEEKDKFFFKVPSLRNIAKTGPYLHDGSITSLDEMVKIMGEYQTPGGAVNDEETVMIVAFLNSLTGELPRQYIAKPALPENGEETPGPNVDAGEGDAADDTAAG